MNGKSGWAEVKDWVIVESQLSLKYMSLARDDVERLHELAGRILSKKNDILSKVVSLIISDPEGAEIVRRHGLNTENVKELLEEWLIDVFRGDYDEKHTMSLFQMAVRYLKAGVNERLIIDTVGVLALETIKLLDSADDILAFTKALFWNLSIMLYSYEYVEKRMAKEMLGANAEKLMKRLNTIFSERILKELQQLPQ